MERVDAGTTVANTTSSSLSGMVSNSTQVLTLINNIASAADEQADMIAQISTVLLNTANTVQDNAKFAHEAAATAEELNAQSETLQELVRYFKL
jgi:methyl-accepting chemotaxis protein